ncbi:MAG TPA: hypothetical protein VF692_09315 [Pyrinomonadaceae bacterium]
MRVNNRGDYVFFDLEIAKNARVGRYEFEVSTASGKTTVPFEFSAPLASANLETFTNDDVIYLVMTDGFMNLPSATKEAAKMQVAFILATRGIPQLYYGEEILMTGGTTPTIERIFPAVSRATRRINSRAGAQRRTNRKCSDGLKNGFSYGAKI